jgi:hypothetical protein
MVAATAAPQVERADATAPQAEPAETAPGSATTAPQAEPDIPEALRIRIELLKLERNCVKLDPFHMLYAYKRTLKKRHGIYQTFSGFMCDALFIICGEDSEREENSLTEKLFVDPNSRFF